MLTEEQIEKILEDAPDGDTHIYIAKMAYLKGKIDVFQEALEILKKNDNN